MPTYSVHIQYIVQTGKDEATSTSLHIVYVRLSLLFMLPPLQVL